MNLGSPDSPAVGDVRRFLREFLMDGRVMDIPWVVRFFLVQFLILPSRPKESAEAYRKVWLPEGSPLVVTSKNVREKLQARIGAPVELAMRYQNPRIEQAVDNLLEHGIDEILLIPLFPHYAMSSYETAVEKTRTVLHHKAPGVKLVVQPPFFDQPDFIQALVASARETLDRGYDHLLFSFHGLPERQLKKPTQAVATASRLTTVARATIRRMAPAIAHNASKPWMPSFAWLASRRKNSRWRSSPGLAVIRGCNRTRTSSSPAWPSGESSACWSFARHLSVTAWKPSRKLV